MTGIQDWGASLRTAAVTCGGRSPKRLAYQPIILWSVLEVWNYGGWSHQRSSGGAKKEGKHVNLENLWSFVLRTGITSLLVYSVYAEKTQLTCMPVNHMLCVLIKIRAYPALSSLASRHKHWPDICHQMLSLPMLMFREFNHTVGLELWLLFFQSSDSEIPSYCCINTWHPLRYM